MTANLESRLHENEPPAYPPATSRNIPTSNLLIFLLIAAGLVPRLLLSYATFLNPDEALHYLLSVQPSLQLAYRASLSTVHPPLYIVFLHYWQAFGHSEFILRLPSVLAGIGFCYLTYLWVKRVASSETALTALILALFSPSLIMLSAEVRQYSLLLLFASLSLYFLERSFSEDSVVLLVISFAALDLALLTHYSGIIFAVCVALYALALFSYKPAHRPLLATWIGGQLSALALLLFLYRTHISVLRAGRMPHVIADTYLRGSTFHPGQDHILTFILRTNIRFFHYLFAQGAVGAVGLFFFLAGLWFLMGPQGSFKAGTAPLRRGVGLLLLAPFVLNCGLALAGLYPYGGTRHNSILAEFAVSGIAIGLTAVRISRRWLNPLVLLALVVCNLFPAPTGAYIQPKDQARTLMSAAVQFLRALPPDSLIVTDNGGGLLLTYYFCHGNPTPYQPPAGTFTKMRCGWDWLVVPDPDAQDRLLYAMRPPTAELYGLTNGTEAWIFEAGWITGGKNHDATDEIRRLNCRHPLQFGRNILLCKTALLDGNGH